MNTAKGLLGIMILTSFNFCPCTGSTNITESFQKDLFRKISPLPSAPVEISSSFGIKHKTKAKENFGAKLPLIVVASGVSREDPSKSSAATEGLLISRPKRQATPVSLGTNVAKSGLHRNIILKSDKSLEALLKGFVEDHMEGCDLIVIFDSIFKGSRALESLSVLPVIKQVLHPLSLEDWTEKIEWETKNCVGTFLLLSDPDHLISFGNINRFHWSYKAKVIIVGLSLLDLEMFLKTVKGRKTEHIIGVVENISKKHFSIYMNLLFWGEGLKQMTDWKSGNFTKNAVLFPDKITNLKQANIKVLIFEYGPILFYEFAPDRTIVARHGRFLSVVRTLSEKFNFTIDFKDIENEYGQPLGNGSFDGLAGYLQRDEGHLGLPYIYHSGLQDRHWAQDYSRFIEDDKSCFLVRREAPIPAWQSLGLPFTQQSWIAVIAGIILSGPIF